jgi:demethylmenaquinone methyltransferase/2-methoxy-6-polyprenyl-1,4-benzoquinol methylase
MSSLAFMRWLESAPLRYDIGMRVITLGRVDRLYEAVAAAATRESGSRVLEIGCGTGAVTERLIAGGASVCAIDQNPEMIEQARARLAAVPEESVRFLERTAAEIDSLEEGAYDAVVASLCFSEMAPSERAFVLEEALGRLRPGGVLAVADELRPRHPGARVLVGFLRLPQAAAAWLIAGSLSQPIADLPGEISAAGFTLMGEQRWLCGSLGVILAERPR